MRKALVLIACAFACVFSGAASARPSVAAGGWHSLAVHADGTVRTWGDDSAGALGVGRSLTSSSPFAVPVLTGVVAVAAGGNHSLALLADGTVWAWGSNDEGELGDGTTTSRSTPVQVVGLTGVVKIAAGGYHTIALRSDGSVWSWGTNNSGQQADDGDKRVVPAPIAGLSGIVDIAAGTYHSLGLKSDGSVWAWGWDADGQLGDGHPAQPWERKPDPIQVPGISGVVKISGGGLHSVALRNDGSVWAWGNNDGGTVGDGTMVTRSTPTQVVGLADVAEISAGYFYTAARRRDGTVWAWGEGGYCNIGDGTCDNHPTPIVLAGVTEVAQLAAGFVTTLAVRTDGGLWAWGGNGTGQYGDGTTDSSSTPVRVAGITGIAAVSLGGYHTVALTTDGRVLTWGDNSQGQLGNAVLTFRSTPSVVPGLANVTAVAGSLYHSLALTTDGNVYAWGTNLANQFQDNGVGHATPQRIKDVQNATAISAGAFHSVALLADGTVRTWGSNYRGLLGAGNDDTGNPNVVIVLGLSNVQQVSAGGVHTLALKRDGTVWAWGQNDSGQLGDGTTTDRFAPVQVVGISDAVEVAAGPAHSLVRLRDGSLFAWGRAYEGQLGDGSSAGVRPNAVRVRGLTGATQLAAGRDFSLALVDGNVWAWGVNYNGGIGCPDCDGRGGPIRIPGLTRIAQVASFQFHALALRDDGSVFSFGDNNLGQLGDGTLVNRESAVVVLHEGGTGSVAGNDWFLDLDPAAPTTIAPENVPVFLVVASSQANNVVAAVKYRAQDVGTVASTFVFALAPVSMVRGAAEKKSFAGYHARGAPKDAPVACALAQLNAVGQLIAVSAASLKAYVSGVLGAQAQSVDILKAVSPSSVAGATFYVGYGTDGQAMLVNGTTRSVVSVPASISCSPQAPQTGWWYNPAEPGRGFSIESRGTRLFFAAFHYDAAGHATWNFAGGATSLDGSLFTSDFLGASGGQTLTGAYKLPGLTPMGNVTFAFSDATHGTMSWPGGNTPIERQPIVPNGLTAPAQANLPESGWWWNPQESGRGFFIEWQNGVADLAGYMYDAAGNPTWYISAYATPDPRVFSGNWWTYADGQSMGGAFKPATRTSDNAGSVRVDFTSATTATMTLPDGRRIPLERQSF